MLFKEFTLSVDPAKLAITHQGELKVLEEGLNLQKAKEEIAASIKQTADRIRNDASNGGANHLKKLPLLNIFPLIAIYHTTNTAEKVTFGGDHLDYDFSPLSFKILSKDEDDSFLKPIKHTFAPMRDHKGQRAFQLVVDENFPNAYISKFLQSKRKFSMQEFFALDPRFALFKALLTTSTIGMAIPTFKEQYGEGKRVDAIFSINHDDVTELSEDLDPSGFSIDGKGNFKVEMNIHAKMIVENKNKWEEARNMVLTLSLKGKIFVADADFDNRTLVFLPRGIQLANLKIFKGDEEQFLEQMLFQSLIGVQLDQFKKNLKPQVFPLKDLDNPPELQCFGFNLTNMDVFINKGYIQLNSNYIKIERDQLSEFRREFCEVLEGTLRSSPEKFQDMLGHYIPGLSHLKKTGEAFAPGKELK